jgi:hypothetical protein
LVLEARTVGKRCRRPASAHEETADGLEGGFIAEDAPVAETFDRQEVGVRPAGGDALAVGRPPLVGSLEKPSLAVDRRTGAEVHPVVVGEATGEPIDPRNLRVRRGPGFPDDAGETEAARFEEAVD